MTTYNLTVYDSVQLVESQSRNVTLSKSLTDEIGSDDSVIANRNRGLAIAETLTFIEMIAAVKLNQTLTDLISLRESGLIKHYRNGVLENIVAIYVSSTGLPPPAGGGAGPSIDSCGYVDYPIATVFSCPSVVGLADLTLTSTPNFGNSHNYNFNTILNESLHGSIKLYGLFEKVEIQIFTIYVKSDSERIIAKNFFKQAAPYPITITTHLNGGLSVTYFLASPVVEFKETNSSGCQIFEAELNFMKNEE